MSAKIAKGEAMSTAALARNTATALVGRVELRTRSRMLAYEVIAREVGRSVTWVRALISNGLGRVDGEVGRVLDALLIRELEADIARLQHELLVARQCGDRLDSFEIGEIETHLARVSALLSRRAR